MHRTIEASVPLEASSLIINDLLLNPHVININVNSNASIKPVGDTLSIHVLNRGADEVLKIIKHYTHEKDFSIVTSEIASLTDPKHQKQINHDIDEAIWEEMETGLRHNGRTTQNYIILMFVGGIIATVGFISEIHDLVIAFIAASIIAPGLEPVAKIPLGIALRKTDVLWTGLKASVFGYVTLIFASWLTFLVLVKFGIAMEEDFLNNKATEGLLHFRLKDFILSFAAATASIVMYLSYRRNVIAGPLIALILIPAAAAIGISIYLQRWNEMFGFIQRLSIDIGLIIFVGIVWIIFKQATVHKRKPMR